MTYHGIVHHHNFYLSKLPWLKRKQKSKNNYTLKMTLCLKQILSCLWHTQSLLPNIPFFHFLPYFTESRDHCVYFSLTGLSKTFLVKGEIADVLKSVCHMLYTVTVQFLPSNLSAVIDWRPMTKGKDCVSIQFYLQLSDWIWNKNGIWPEPCQG